MNPHDKDIKRKINPLFPRDIFPEDVFPKDVFPPDLFPREDDEDDERGSGDNDRKP